jgi:ATP-binding cassette subfamily B protein
MGRSQSVRRVVRYFRPYRRQIAVVLLCIGAASALGLLPPLLVRALIDAALPHRDLVLLNYLIAGMLGAAAAAGLVGVLQGYLISSISFHIMYDLRVALYRNLQRQSLAFYTNTRAGELTSRILADIIAINSVISGTLFSVVGNLIIFLSTLSLMFALDRRLTVVSLALLPWLVLPTRRVGNLRRGIRAQRQKKLADMMSFIQETLGVSGALLIKAFAREDAEALRLESKARDVMEWDIRETLVGRWFFMGLGLVPAVGAAAIYWFGGRSVIGAGMTLGTVVAFVALLGRLHSPATSFARLHTDIVSSLVHFERIFQYLDQQPEIDDAPGAREMPTAEGRIAFQNVTFEYVKGRPVLQDLSFTVRPGQLAALVGPTGAGKTTVTYLVPRLYVATSGSLRVDDYDTREVTLASLRRQIGIVTQETFLFHGSVRENLLFVRQDATEDEMIRACRAAHIHDVIAQLPEGYDTVVGERGYRLSGGEKQRLAIARVLLKDPRIVILDEATSALDSQSERLIQAALERLLKGRTSLVIAHRLSTILAADVILVLDRGRLVEQGTHEELLARRGLYTQLYEAQFKPQAAAVAEAGLPQVEAVSGGELKLD